MRLTVNDEFMTTEQQRALQAAEDFRSGDKKPEGNLEKNPAKTTNEDVFVNADQHVLPIDQTSEEVTNNDGSIIETLDTAFHEQPGVIKEHSVAGSNHAEYYEEGSQGKNDAEEEQDFLKKQ